MKKIISLILSVVMLTSFAFVVPAAAAEVASGTCGTALTWVLDDAGTLTISGTGEMTNWGGSSKVPWKSYNSSIKKVVFPSTITAIYSWSFFYCNSLKEVTIPPSVEFIDWFAFPSLDSITGYKYSAAYNYAMDEDIAFISLGDLPEAVVSEGSCGEGVTYSLTNRGVMTISGSGEISAYEYEESPWAKYMFNVKDVVIEEGVTAIGDGAFNGNIKIESVSIPEGVTSIGSMAFYGCNYIEELSLPSTLLTIGDSAFNSTGITELAVPEKVTSIGSEAFAYAPITTVTIPESVTYIGDSAFGGGETTPVISGVKGSYAETYANKNGYVFKGQVTAVNGNIGDSITWLLNEEGTLTISGTGQISSWGSDTRSPWYVYRENIVEVVVEDGITYLGGYSFWYNTALEKVTIPESVTYVDFYFIWNASQSITIKGATYSEAYVYANNRGYKFESTGLAAKREVASGNCGEGVTYSLDNYGILTISGTGKITSYSDWYSYRTDIKDIVIENGVTSICSDAFTMCDELKSVTIPVSVTYVDDWSMPTGTGLVVKGYDPSAAKTFAENRGFNFESLGTAPIATIASGRCGASITWTLDNYGLLKITGTGAMSYSSGGGNVAGSIVGADVVLMAQSYEVPWDNYRSSIKTVEISEGITTIADYAFYSCDNLTEVELPESITSIGEYAFYACDVLAKVKVHYNVTEIPNSAFGYSYNVVIYGYTGSAAEEAASYRGLGFVSLGEAPLVVIASGDVTDTITWTLDNRGLLTVTGSGEMPEYTFNGPRPWDEYRTTVKSVAINGVDRVYRYSFSQCDNLTSVVVQNVKYLDSYAFNYCDNITEATVYPSVGAIGSNAFYYNASYMTIKGVPGSYAQMYAEYVGSTFEAMEGETEINTVYVSTVDELIAAIASNTTIILEDGIYLLDKTAYLGNTNYTWEYADVLRLENVINLTIKARNPGKVEILAPQSDMLNYYSYENSLLYIAGAYNLVIDGIRIGNMTMRANNGRVPSADEAELMGGYEEGALNGFYGAYISSAGSSNYVPVINKVSFVNCDIFNCAYAVSFNGGTLTVDNCTIRDNVKGAIAAYGDGITVKDSVFSRNGNSTDYRGTYCLDMRGTVTNCTFINNGNEYYCSGTLTEEGNVFSDNVWNGETMKAYGITKNGITWSVAEGNVLKLGYTIDATDASFESKTGEIYPYSVSSLPWKEYDIASVKVNDGVVYNPLVWGSCGRDVTWQYDEKTKTLTLSGTGDMSDLGYIEEFYNNYIENIVIADTITGVYNLFTGTAYYANENNRENGILYIGDVLVWAKKDLTGEVTVKEGTRVIADEAFRSCSDITKIVLPESVEHIGVTEKLDSGSMGNNGVFEGCTSLVSLTIPVSVTEIDHAAFNNCKVLKDIYYSGTMAQWKEITIGKNNEELDYCYIHATDGTIEPPTYFYRITDSGAVITSISPVAENVVIPSEIDGAPVVSIDDGIFANQTVLKSVVIEADIEEAPYFTNSKSLERVELSDGVKYVGNIFEGCESLESITLGDNIKEMDANAFDDTAYYRNSANWDGGILYVNGYATALAENAAGKVTVRSNAKAVCYNTFNNNSTVTEIVIPDGVKVQQLGENFYNMSALKSVTIPDTFVKPEYSFGVFDCESLESITVSKNNASLTSVDGVVFTKDMTELVYLPMGRSGSYEIPDGVTTLGAYSFMNTHISKLTIPASVNNIGNSAFSSSNYLSDIYYNITVDEWENLENIYIGYGNDAFNNANLHLLDYEFVADTISYRLSGDGSYYIVSEVVDYVEEVEIPAEYNSLPVKEVDSYAFSMKSRLSKITVDGDNKYLTSVDGVLFTKDMKTLVAYPAGSAADEYTVPEGVEAIAAQAFSYSKNLESIDLGTTLTTIGMWAFKGSGIKSVTIPETVTELVSGVFNTASLESVSFGTNIKSVTTSTFSDSLKYIYFGGTQNEWYNVSGWYNIKNTTKIVTKVEINAFVFREEEEVIRLELSVQGIEQSVEQGNEPDIFILGLDRNENNVTVDSVSMEELYSGQVMIKGDEEVLDQVQTVKIFVWESLESMRPLGEPIEVEVYNFE